MARYKFACRSCEFECITGIGKEVGLNSSKVVMVCNSCSTIEIYIVVHPGSINTDIARVPICKSCHTSAHLLEWDGLTCPHCKMHIRAVGTDIDIEQKGFKYRRRRI
jgi:hypothetical protein